MTPEEYITFFTSEPAQLLEATKKREGLVVLWGDTDIISRYMKWMHEASMYIAEMPTYDETRLSTIETFEETEEMSIASYPGGPVKCLMYDPDKYLKPIVMAKVWALIQTGTHPNFRTRRHTSSKYHTAI
jgi:hypothetical protein